MRSDISSAFIAAKNAESRQPRQLLIFHFPISGDVFLSDQQLGATQGLADEYQPLVENWGVLKDVIGEKTGQDPGIVRQLSITIWNGGSTPFSDYFLIEPPEDVEVSLYQWFIGLPDADKVLIDRLVVQDPITFSESSRLLHLDLVGMAIRWDQPVGTFINRASWPHAAPEVIGKGIPLVFGSPGQIPTLKVSTALSVTLANSILASGTIIPVNEDLNKLNFPTEGALQICDEQISYTARTAASFINCSRGVNGTKPNQHLRNETIIEVLSDHTFLLCEGPVDQISNVLIDGFPAPANLFTVDALANPAKIIFSAQPYYEKFSNGSKFLEMQFDAVGTGNSALDPANAFDADETASSALINNTHNKLVLVQNTINQDRGQILKAYLSIAHWESGQMAADYVKIEVSGIGEVGRLARPNASDVFDIDGDVDIDHGHLHSTGAAHSHTTVDPDFSSSSDAHDHTMTVDTAEVTTGIGSFPLGTWITKSGTYATIDYISFPTYNNNRGVWVEYSMSWYVAGYTTPVVELHISIGGSWHTIPLNAVGGSTVYIGSGAHSGSPYISYRSSSSSTACKFKITACAIIWHAINSISPKAIAIATTKSQAGYSMGQGADVNDDPIKASDDVHNLVTGNMPLNINAQDNPSRTITDKFDITENVDFSWSWFTGKTVTMTYVSSGTNKDVHVLHAFFMVEFAPKEIVFSDQVSAEVVGKKTEPVDVVKYLLTEKASMAEAMLDMANAAATFANLNYTLDGLINADLTAAEAVRKICQQVHSRIFNNGGKVKLVVKTTNQTEQKTIGSSSTQLKSITITRQPISDVKNSINLAYNFDWLGKYGFQKSITADDSPSINRFGKRISIAGHQFDLIRNEAMAIAVADYYLSVQAWPNTFYEFTSYLNQFELECEDCISLSANFNKLTNTTMTVKATDRIFASGKNQQINHVKIFAESIFVYTGT